MGKEKNNCWTFFGFSPHRQTGSWKIYQLKSLRLFLQHLALSWVSLTSWGQEKQKYLTIVHSNFTTVRLLWWTAGWKRPQWQWWAVAGGQRAGRVQDVEVGLQTASCSSLWNSTGTRAASNAPAATLSWASTAAPATAKEAWSSARTITSGCLDTVEPAVLVDSLSLLVRWWCEHKATFTTLSVSPVRPVGTAWSPAIAFTTSMGQSSANMTGQEEACSADTQHHCRPTAWCLIRRSAEEEDGKPNVCLLPHLPPLSLLYAPPQPVNLPLVDLPPFRWTFTPQSGFIHSCYWFRFQLATTNWLFWENREEWHVNKSNALSEAWGRWGWLGFLYTADGCPLWTVAISQIRVGMAANGGKMEDCHGIIPFQWFQWNHPLALSCRPVAVGAE